MTLEKIKKSIIRFPWLTADLVTTTRLISSLPLFIFVLKKWYTAALTIFLIMSLTDALDGYLARLRKSSRPAGVVFDSLTDMIFFLPSFLIIGLKYLDWRIVFCLLGLEILRGLLVLMAKILKFPLKIEANLPGKIKGCFEVFGLIFLLLAPGRFITFASVFFGIAIFFAFLNISFHLARNLKIE